MSNLVFAGAYVQTGKSVKIKADYVLFFPSGIPVGIDVENGNLPCRVGPGRPVGMWSTLKSVKKYRDAMAKYEKLTIHRLVGVMLASLEQEE